MSRSEGTVIRGSCPNGRRTRRARGRDALRTAGSAGPVAHDAPMGRAPTMLTHRRTGGGWLCDRRPSTTTTPHHPLTRSNRTWPTYPAPLCQAALQSTLVRGGGVLLYTDGSRT